MYKFVLFIMFIIGIISITASISISIGENTNVNNEPKIVYRYLPRTLEEEQKEPIAVSELYNSMFTQTSPWIGGMNDLDLRKRELVNQYFISQT